MAETGDVALLTYDLLKRVQGQYHRMDRFDERHGRIERRLDLIDV